jgi:uncharacterized membrane protein
MTHVAAYLGALATMLALDTVMLSRVLRPLFERDVPHLLAERPNFSAAAVFYVVYVLGLWYFVLRPGLAEQWDWIRVLGTGAALGAMAYATFELTNMAVLRGWTWSMVVVDIAWGALLTALVAAAGVAAGRAAAPA